MDYDFCADLKLEICESPENNTKWRVLRREKQTYNTLCPANSYDANLGRIKLKR